MVIAVYKLMVTSRKLQLATSWATSRATTNSIQPINKHHLAFGLKTLCNQSSIVWSLSGYWFICVIFLKSYKLLNRRILPIIFRICYTLPQTEHKRQTNKKACHIIYVSLSFHKCTYVLSVFSSTKCYPLRRYGLSSSLGISYC